VKFKSALFPSMARRGVSNAIRGSVISANCSNGTTDVAAAWVTYAADNANINATGAAEIYKPSRRDGVAFAWGSATVASATVASATVASATVARATVARANNT